MTATSSHNRCLTGMTYMCAVCTKHQFRGHLLHRLSLWYIRVTMVWAEAAVQGSADPVPSGHSNFKLTSQCGQYQGTTSIDLILTSCWCQIANIIWTSTYEGNMMSRMCLENDQSDQNDGQLMSTVDISLMSQFNTICPLGYNLYFHWYQCWNLYVLCIATKTYEVLAEQRAAILVSVGLTTISASAVPV